MIDRAQYTPGPASGAQVRKDGQTWALILVRELRHSPEKVWQALTDPAHLREWAPFEADNWGGNDMRWELENLGGGTRLTLWTSIDRRFISMGAAGWHICFDALERLLAGEPIWTHGRRRGHEVRLAAAERGVREAIRYGSAQVAASGGSKVVNRGGSQNHVIELEQMGSADPPLAVHCLYRVRHRQHRCRGTGEVHR